MMYVGNGPMPSPSSIAYPSAVLVLVRSVTMPSILGKFSRRGRRLFDLRGPLMISDGADVVEISRQSVGVDILARCEWINVHASEPQALRIRPVGFFELSATSTSMRITSATSIAQRKSTIVAGCVRLNCARCGRTHAVPRPSVTEHRTTAARR